MKIDSEKVLLDQLAARSWDAIHKVLTDKPSLEAIKIWWKFGRDQRRNDRAWLNRQIRSGDYNTLGLMCIIASMVGARTGPFGELERLFGVIAEEKLAEKKATPRGVVQENVNSPLHHPPESTLFDGMVEERERRLGHKLSSDYRHD